MNVHILSLTIFHSIWFGRFVQGLVRLGRSSLDVRTCLTISRTSAYVLYSCCSFVRSLIVQFIYIYILKGMGHWPSIHLIYLDVRPKVCRNHSAMIVCEWMFVCVCVSSTRHQRSIVRGLYSHYRPG